MEIAIQFTDHPIRVESCPPRDGIGAVLEFAGAVRRIEQGSRISALVYEIYEPMASKTIRRILEKLGESFPCEYVKVVHRHGVVPVGETSIYVRVESEHRGEGLRLMENFMNCLKTEVPIWKVRSVPC